MSQVHESIPTQTHHQIADFKQIEEYLSSKFEIEGLVFSVSSF